jgi:protein MpaA
MLEKLKCNAARRLSLALSLPCILKQKFSLHQTTVTLALSLNIVLPGAVLHAQEFSPAKCEEILGTLPKTFEVNLAGICKEAKLLTGCQSEKAVPIFHVDRTTIDANAKRILVFSLVHGDEPESGVVANMWMDRLMRIQPRSHWRIVPVLNPDGYAANSRLNSKGVDLNRNFPTSDWDKQAFEAWDKKAKKDPRRYPGISSGSESETKCALAHIEEFKPDFVIAIHTPYGLLDFDGPKDLNFPKSFLPWISLGHFPGSLGRYMWADRSVPVLTIELSGKDSLKSLSELDRLQDVSGSLAIQATGKSHSVE